MSTPKIMGCKFCGDLRLDHGRQWHDGKGWHGYHTPTREQIRARWKEHMNAREAKRRQQLIHDTLFGLRAMLTEDQTLLQEMDPDQEQAFKDLIELAVHRGIVEI